MTSVPKFQLFVHVKGLENVAAFVDRIVALLLPLDIGAPKHPSRLFRFASLGLGALVVLFVARLV